MKSPRVALAVLTATAVTAMAGCGSGGQEDNAENAPSVDQTLTAAVTGSWAGFNPYVPDQGVGAGLALANAIYPSAFNVQPDQTAVLNDDLLEGAEVTSEDPLTVVYTINPEANWADGEPITADDFIYLWQHLNGSNEQFLVTAAIGYSQIGSVTADGDPKTVKVEFTSPFADWQSLFTTLLPAHHMASLGDDVAAWNTGLVQDPGPAGGPYQVAENSEGEFIRLDVNPEWYGDEPGIEEITLRYLSDGQAAIQALASGEVDLVFDLRATKALIGQAEALTDVTSEVVPTTNQLFINTQFSSPTVGDLAVRQAIATVLDPAAIAESVFGDGAAELLTSHHIYAPTSPYYRDNRPDGFGSGDADAAMAILEDAGYAKGSDGVYAKGDTKLALDYIARSEDQAAEQVGVLVQDELKKIGIAVEVRSVASADYFPTLGSAEYDINLGNYPASAFPVSWYGGLYPCEAGFNFARYCNNEVDATYYQAYGTLDAEAQADLVNQADEMMWADVANIPMFEVPQLVAHASNVEGVRTLLPKEYQLLDMSHWSVG